MARLVGLLALLALPAGAAEPEPGLLLTFESAAGGARDMRVARLLALRVPAGERPTPFLPPGPFHATFEGFLELEERDRYTFSASLAGTLELEIEGKVVLAARGEDAASQKSKPARLNKGRNRLVARYQSPVQGEAFLRVSFASSEHGLEPPSPTILGHEAGAPALSEADRRRRGRDLFTSLRCLRCHVRAMPIDEAREPELALDAPVLTGIGARAKRDYLAAWIEDPRRFRPDTAMPRVPLPEGGARDLAAYLATQGKPPEGDAPARSAAGEASFTSLGCVACHVLPGSPAREGDPERIPLAHVHDKWWPRALAEFLRQPERGYAWSRMPNFHLSEVEANALAGHLLALPPLGLAASEGDAARGAALFRTAGCASCHVGDVPNELAAPPLADLARTDGTRGCLGADAGARGRAPDFGLGAGDRACLAEFVRRDLDSLGAFCAPEFAAREIQRLRCLNCHSRDEHHTDWQGAEPTGGTPPNLTWTGEKLHPEWVESFIGGRLNDKPRPWLVARMPAFTSRAHGLALGLAAQHGVAATSEPDAPAAATLAAAGKKLVGAKGGFSCTACHAVGKQPALQVFEAQGLNFMYAAERLQREYFLRWIMDPMRIDPASRMPRYCDDKGRTAFTEILDGDAHRQFEAIWEYFKSGRAIEPP
jgi:cytochrome c2